MQNGFVESFNGQMRDELLNETMFRNLAHARIVIAAWAADYNTERPHSALDYQTPADYARTLTAAIARPAARDESSARRAIAQPAPIRVNTNRAPVAAGGKFRGRSPVLVPRAAPRLRCPGSPPNIPGSRHRRCSAPGIFARNRTGHGRNPATSVHWAAPRPG